MTELGGGGRRSPPKHRGGGGRPPSADGKGGRSSGGDSGAHRDALGRFISGDKISGTSLGGSADMELTASQLIDGKLSAEVARPPGESDFISGRDLEEPCDMQQGDDVHGKDINIMHATVHGPCEVSEFSPDRFLHGEEDVVFAEVDDSHGGIAMNMGHSNIIEVERFTGEKLWQDDFCMGSFISTKTGEKTCAPHVCANALTNKQPLSSYGAGHIGHVWSRPALVRLPAREEGSSHINGDHVQLDVEEIDSMIKKFENALVGRMFGRRIPFPFLNMELQRRWQGFGPFRLVTISTDCFICFFDNAEGRNGVLIGGPWVVAGQVVGVDSWSPTFSPASSDGFVTPIWVRLPGLPIYCWGSKNITRIAGQLGDPVWMDTATERIERGLFARVCVRVDLSRSLKPGIWLDSPYGSFFQKVEYEGLSAFCFRCGHVGHKENKCGAPKLNSRGPHGVAPPMENTTKSVTKSHPNSVKVGVNCADSNSKVANANNNILHDSTFPTMHGKSAVDSSTPTPPFDDVSTSPGYGPWMIVTRKKWPPKNSRVRHDDRLPMGGRNAPIFGQQDGGIISQHNSLPHPGGSLGKDTAAGQASNGSPGPFTWGNEVHVKQLAVDREVPGSGFQFLGSKSRSDSQRCADKNGIGRPTKPRTDRLLTDLGPVAYGGRNKRRRHVIHNDGGDASSSPPP